MSARAAGGCWPTEDQVLLLRAGLLGPDEARAAWLRWRAEHDPDDADRGSLRLLPLVYRNLLSAGLEANDLGKLKGAYNATWFRNQLLFRRAAHALDDLRDAGIQTMVLKGVALAVAYYRDAGARPMDDVDVLVRPPDADRALAVLSAAGWTTDTADGHRRRIKDAHAQHLQHPDGSSLDLHWSTLAQYAGDDDFWSGSVEIDVLGAPTRALSPAEQLLHVDAHGAQWNRIPPVRWIADAVAVERAAAPELDWERLVAQATHRRVTVSLTAALEHLAAAVRFPVPAWVLERLRAAPKAPLERWAHRAATRPMGAGTWLPVVLDRYRRLSSLDPDLRFTDFAKDHFGVHTRRELAGRIGRKAGEVALTQAALRVAPGRVRSCARCGRFILRLGSHRRLCERC